MALSPGTRIGPYEVIGSLGAGGMGEVYRATDTNLKRAVAIKVLPDSVASDAERLARFQREAEVLARLNHPNIAAIYGLERANGITALVMELVEGPTLADRIAQGPIPVDEALPIAKQIAEALEGAHEQGIIHRDLKPANIKLRPDGTVKVLDFGLAKALESTAARAIDATASPTITSPAMMTGVGVLLGTAAYMSPEQARGKAVDKRSDIWAFGCVLYEMLTGQRAFEGEDASDTIANVLKREPDWASFSSLGVSKTLQLLIRRCLEKDRRQRVRDVSTLLFVIDNQTTLASAADTQETGRDRKIASIPMQRLVMTGAAALLLGGVVATAAVWVALRRPPARVERFGLTPTGASALTISGFSPDLAITADGSQIAYIGDNSRQLFIRTLGTLEPTAIARGSQLRSVFIAPDGQWVGFADEVTTLRKVAIGGGPPITLGILDGNPRGATWTPNDTIIFATTRPGTGLQQLAAGGGEVTVLTKPDPARGEADHLWPEILPGGQAVLFTITPVAGGLEGAKLAVLDLTTGAHKVLMQGGSHAHYIPTGHLVYAVDGTLRAIGFDLERHETRGTPVPVISRLVTNDVGAGEYSVAEDGTLVYVDLPGATSLTGRSLVWVDRRNVEEPLAAPLREYTYSRLSPDGTRLALTIGDQENDIWIWDFGRQTLTRLTVDPAIDNNPLWTPDGRRVIFSSTRSGVANLYWQAADGTGAAERLTESQVFQTATGLSPDGNQLVFHEQTQSMGTNVMMLHLRGERRVQPLLQTRFVERNATISPDGRWMAYESNASGRFEIYVRPFPNVDDGQWPVSTGGGTRAAWAANGRELFYGVEDGLMSVSVESAGATWGAGQPLRIVEGRYFTAGSIPASFPYSVARDGQRFVMIKAPGGDAATPPQIVVVQSWFEELKRLVPTN